MDDVQFLIDQAVHAASEKGGQLVSITFCCNSDCRLLLHAATQALSHAGLTSVDVKIIPDSGSMRLVSLEIAHQGQQKTHPPNSSDALKECTYE